MSIFKKRKPKYKLMPSVSHYPDRVVFTIPVNSIDYDEARETLRKLVKQYTK
jgi:hypothetical protein